MPLGLSRSDFASAIAEEQTSASTVQVRRGLPVVAGTTDSEFKPIPTGTSTIVKTVQGIAQDDANNGNSFRLALAGDKAIARIKGTGNIGDFLIAKTGSTTDDINGSLEVQSTIVNGDLIVARLLQDATDGSYCWVSVLMQLQTAA